MNFSSESFIFILATEKLKLLLISLFQIRKAESTTWLTLVWMVSIMFLWTPRIKQALRSFTSTCANRCLAFRAALVSDLQHFMMSLPVSSSVAIGRVMHNLFCQPAR